MENIGKRGQFGIWGLVAGLVLMLVLLAFFVWNTQFRYVVLGTALAIGGFFVLFKADINKKVKTSLFIGLLAVGLLFVLMSGVLQSILSVSSVSVGADGKVYWVATGVADQLSDETFTFNYKPSNKTLNDGSIVSPKAVDIYVQKQDSYCEYTLNKKSIVKTVFFIPYTLTYYELSNPAKTVNIQVSDSKGDSVVMDGTLVSSKTMNDNDGKGSVTIQTNGLLSGKMNCPEQSDVIVVGNKFLSKSAYLSMKGTEVSGLAENTNFIRGFETAPVISGTSSVRGDLNSIGNVVFTFTADQDYFNSVVYTPSVTGNPSISSVNINDIKPDSTGTASVNIKNLNSGNALFVVKGSISNGAVNPSSQNVYISGSKTVYLNIKTNDMKTTDSLKIEVCSVNQFGSSKCDTASKSFDIKDSVSTFCGDGNCDSNENNVTCSQDCKLVQPIPIPDLVCDKWYQIEGTQTDYKYNILFFKFGATTTPVCKVNPLINIIAVVVVIIVLGSVALYSMKPKRKKK